jgi:hypothetical protein
MKHLFIALVCTVMGFSAMASEGTPSKTLPLSKNAPEKVAFEKIASEKTAVEKKATEKSTKLRRRTTAYIFHLSCGDVIVHVYNDAVNVPGVMNGIWNHFNNQNCN